jgi:arginine decarboxylase
MFPVPTSVFLTRGVGVHRDQLTAFEFALREADIEQQNLVSVSSIMPPGCRLIAAIEGVETLRPGDITFCVLARAETNEPGRRIHASIGLARPTDPSVYGYISEYHGFGKTELESGDYAEDLAATMLASTLGIDFDPTAPGTNAVAFMRPAATSSTAPRSLPRPKGTSTGCGLAPSQSPSFDSLRRRLERLNDRTSNFFNAADFSRRWEQGS